MIKLSCEGLSQCGVTGYSQGVPKWLRSGGAPECGGEDRAPKCGGGGRLRKCGGVCRGVTLSDGG